MKRPADLNTHKELLWSPGTGHQVWSMLVAAETGDIPTLRRLLKQRPALIRCQYHYRNPVETAVKAGQEKAALFLLERGSPPFRDMAGTARERGFHAFAEKLERQLAALGVSPLGEPVAAAIRARDAAALHQLLDANPQLLHSGDQRGNQPIHWATMTRQPALIEALVRRGADPNARRPDGARPIQLAGGDYHHRGWRDVPDDTATPAEVRACLLALGATLDLCTACWTGDETAVRSILAADPAAANRPSEYNTYYVCSGSPLRNAAEGGHDAIVRLLLAHGADPNLPAEHIAPLGHALHSAVYRGHRHIVELLVAHGARPNVPVESSADTLSAAIRAKDRAMVNLLTSHGASRSVELLGYYGDTLTAAAVFAANPRLANDTQALAYAAEEGHEPFVRLMLRYQPRLARRISLAAKSTRLTKLLFDHGMTATLPDWLGATALHRFAQSGDLANARLFLSHGARLEARDADLQTTPLGWAARAGKSEMVHWLLSQGAHTRLRNAPDWAQPARLAAWQGHSALAELLKENAQ